MVCLQSVDFLKSMRWKCEICFPSYCFLLSTKFQLAFIETCDASLGWNKGTRVQPFFFGQTFSLIDWLDFLSLGVGGGGGRRRLQVWSARNEVEHSCGKPYQIPHRGLMIEAGNLAIPSVHLFDWQAWRDLVVLASSF